MDWLHYLGQENEGGRSLERKDLRWRTRSTSGNFSEGFKRQIVELYNAGKPVSEIMSEYDLDRSTVRRWITRINGTGSSKAADNRTPEQQRLLELERENKRLRMEVDNKLNRRPRKRLGYRTSYGARCSETLHLI